MQIRAREGAGPWVCGPGPLWPPLLCSGPPCRSLLFASEECPRSLGSRLARLLEPVERSRQSQAQLHPWGDPGRMSLFSSLCRWPIGQCVPFPLENGQSLCCPLGGVSKALEKVGGEDTGPWGWLGLGGGHVGKATLSGSSALTSERLCFPIGAGKAPWPSAPGLVRGCERVRENPWGRHQEPGLARRTGQGDLTRVSLSLGDPCGWSPGRSGLCSGYGGVPLGLDSLLSAPAPPLSRCYLTLCTSLSPPIARGYRSDSGTGEC